MTPRWTPTEIVSYVLNDKAAREWIAMDPPVTPEELYDGFKESFKKHCVSLTLTRTQQREVQRIIHNWYERQSALLYLKRNLKHKTTA